MLCVANISNSWFRENIFFPIHFHGWMGDDYAGQRPAQNKKKKEKTNFHFVVSFVSWWCIAWHDDCVHHALDNIIIASISVQIERAREITRIIYWHQLGWARAPVVAVVGQMITEGWIRTETWEGQKNHKKKKKILFIIVNNRMLLLLCFSLSSSIFYVLMLEPLK